MRLRMGYTKTYKHPELFKCRLYAMIFANADGHLLIIFDISNSTQYPIYHSGYLHFTWHCYFDTVNHNSNSN